MPAAPRIALVGGSPVPESRTWSFAAAVGDRLQTQGFAVDRIDLSALPAEELLRGPGGAGPVRSALDAVARAQGFVVATPVHHAAYSGILKAFLDLLPRAGLGGKVALPLAVGGSTAHVLTLDYALRPVLMALGAAQVTRGHFLLSGEIDRGPDGATRLQWEAERRLDAVLREFVLRLGLHAKDDAIPMTSDAGDILIVGS